jgi:hypothetical protein
LALSTLSLALSHPTFFSFESPDQFPDLTRLYTPITQADAGEEAAFALHTVNVPLQVNDSDFGFRFDIWIWIFCFLFWRIWFRL